MDFQSLLLKIGQALSTDEVKSMAFLCAELLGKSPTSVESASDLFSRLTDQDQLSAERPYLLNELLLTIQRHRLARDHGLIDQVPPYGNYISRYRKLLYSLSEELTDQDLKSVKFLLVTKLPRKKLEDHITTLEVFLEMEHADLISETNLDLLESIIQSVCPMLTEKIRQYKAQNVELGCHVAQETSRPRSRSYPFHPAQVSRADNRTFAGEMPAMQPLSESGRFYSNTSVDHSVLPHPGNDLAHRLSGLMTGTSSGDITQVRNDAVVISSQADEITCREPTDLTSTNKVLETYPIPEDSKGICLIINNYDFSNSKKGLKKREGTMIDEDCLRKVFEWLGFVVEIQTDCEGQRMLSVMQELSSRNHEQTSCLVCCLLSHGQEGGVYGVDGREVSIRKMMECFQGVNCSSLIGKPKLFFIQACQGTNEQRPVYLQSDGAADNHLHSDAIEVTVSIPSDADFLLGMATVPSFVSYRDCKQGTWFIQSLCQNLVEMVPRGMDLVSILTKVNDDVSRKTDSRGEKKQMPQPAFTLRKRVVFPNPGHPPPSL
ncbi:uncharacterized protein V6R79_016841 [Siganus canaliculatus]